jgi:hypothetical protein
MLFKVILLIAVVGFALLIVALRREGRAAIRRAAESPRWPFATGTPARIRLRPVEDVGWENSEEVEAQSSLLRELGFRDAGTFFVEELEGLHLRGFVRPEEGLRASVNEKGSREVFVEVFARHEDGRKFVLNNRPAGGELEWPEGTVVASRPGLDARGLYRAMGEVRPAGGEDPVGAEGFAADYERGYAELRDWRNLRGGLDERELRSIAAAGGDEASDDWVARTLESEAHRAAMGLSEAAFHRFFAEADLDEVVRYRMTTRLVIVHDRLPIGAIAEVFRLSVAEAEARVAAGCRTGLYDDDLDGGRPFSLAGLPPRRAFVALNDLLPPRRRFRRVGEVAQPIATDLYVRTRP